MATIRERFDAKWTPEPNTGCWLWHGAIDGVGYGAFGSGVRASHKVKRAHRVAYELYRGPIPSGLDIDHLCRVRGCVNPDHLEPVTRAVNVQRGLVPQMNRDRAAAVKQCPRGHAYDEQNTRLDRKGSRYCIVCKREKRRERRARNGH